MFYFKQYSVRWKYVVNFSWCEFIFVCVHSFACRCWYVCELHVCLFMYFRSYFNTQTVLFQDHQSNCSGKSIGTDVLHVLSNPEQKEKIWQRNIVVTSLDWQHHRLKISRCGCLCTWILIVLFLRHIHWIASFALLWVIVFFLFLIFTCRFFLNKRI